MIVDIFWIEMDGTGRLGTMAKPRGWDWIEDEISDQKRQGVDVVVSALTSQETEELGLSDERNICLKQGIEFLSFPIPDYSVPLSKKEFSEFATYLSNLLKKKKNVVVHCRQGIGRSTILAAGALIGLGISSEEALLRIKGARGRPVPDTEDQKQWIQSCEELISRNILPTPGANAPSASLK